VRWFTPDCRAPEYCCKEWSNENASQFTADLVASWRSGIGKMLVDGAVEIDGGKPRRARLKVIEGFGKDELHAFVLGAVSSDGAWASTTDCGEQTSSTTSTNSYSASIGAGHGTPLSIPCSASLPAPLQLPTAC
jgi:hypothetical protein